jgi:hypothetical protein
MIGIIRFIEAAQDDALMELSERPFFAIVLFFRTEQHKKVIDLGNNDT